MPNTDERPTPARPIQRRSPRLLAATVTLIVIGALLGSFGAPAYAAAGIDLSASSGVVGVAQTVTATVGSSADGTATGKVTLTADGKTIGSSAVGGSEGPTATFRWTPSTTGAVVLRATLDTDAGETATDQLTVQVSAVETTTALSVPSTAPSATKVTITAAVAPRSGTYVSTGTVAFRLSTGTSLGTAKLAADGTARLSITTPSSATTWTIIAEYAGDGRAASSTSSGAALKVSASGSKLTLTLPTSARVGQPAEFTAKVAPTTATGTVTFTANGRTLGRTTLAQGTTRLTWTPTAAGTISIAAAYSGGSGVGPSSATGALRVAPALLPDAITVTPAGSTAAWSTTSPIALPNGGQVELVAASTSRLPVTLGVIGPCALSASTLVIRGVGGSCLLTASTKGNGTYASAVQRYTVGTGIGRQTAALKAPSSRSVRRHSSVRLGRINATTNIGQQISWRVTQGIKRCHIKRTAATYRVVFSRKGTCRVRATAPSIPGQWARFSAYRTYRIR